jgi:sugar phosphate isomerase/epimerase
VKLGIVTDEVSADPETAIELGAAWGIHDFELRGVFASRAPSLSPYEKSHLHDALDAYQARVVALSPGLFKFPYPSKERARASLAWMDNEGFGNWAAAQKRLRYHIDELLPASLEYASELGAGIVVVFSFDRAGLPAGPPPDEVLEILSHAADRASAAGIQLAVENEEGFWGDTGEHTANLVRTIGHPAIGVNWDPGNAFCAGDQPFPAAYQAVRGLVRHVHFKDAQRSADGTAVYVAEGQVDWKGQLRALAADGYGGYISVETHLRPKVSSARELLERLRLMVASVTSSNDPR